MRIFSKLTLIITFFFLVVSTIGAQDTKVTKADIDKLQKDARAKLKDISYRERWSSLGYKDSRNPPYYSSIFTTEHLPPDRSRTIWEQKTDKGLKKEEWINIGSTRYIKRGDEAWKLDEPIGSVSGIGGSTGTTSTNGPEIVVKYEYLGEKSLNGTLSDLYQVTTTRTFRRSQGDIVNPSVDKYWFDKRGRLLRSQTDTTDNYSRGLSQTIWEYEYDLDFKIEAPIK